mgnify:CR=1 FL=1
MIEDDQKLNVPMETMGQSEFTQGILFDTAVDKERSLLTEGNQTQPARFSRHVKSGGQRKRVE